MKICLRCQTTYTDTKNFCRHDGTPLEFQKVNSVDQSTSSPTSTQSSSLSPTDRPHPGHRAEFYKGIAVGVTATLFVTVGLLSTYKVQEWLQRPLAREEVTTADKSQSPLSQSMVSSPTFTKAAVGENIKPSETGSDPLAITAPAEGQLVTGTGASLSEEQNARVGLSTQQQNTTLPLGTYRVTVRTPLRSAPREDASVVSQLKPGIRVQVVGVVENYLEVHSKKGRPPGYVRKEHVRLVERKK